MVMRAAVLTAHGDTSVLVIRDDHPRPAPGPGEVLIEVAASSINNTDVWSRLGSYGTAEDPEAVVGWRGVPLTFPRVQGGDVAGEVAELGDGVDRAWLGRRVLVDPALYDGDAPDATPVGLLGSERDGGFAELVAVDVAAVNDVTESPLTDAELACLPVAYGTALGMARRGGLGPGERVAVTGASGGVGLAVVQLASALGAEVVAVTTAEKTDQVRRAGAGDVIDRHDGDPATTARRIGLGPFDVLFDVVGGNGFGNWLGTLAAHGRIVVAGAIAGPVVSIDLRQVYLDQRRIVGSTMHSRSHFAELVELARQGTIRPVIAAELPLQDLHTAQETFLDKDHVGKIVVCP